MLAPLALLKAHPKGAAVAGAGVLGLLVLKRRTSTTNASGQSTDGAAGSATAAGQMGTGVYDSTANDVYSSLEPAIEGLYGQVSQLQSSIDSGMTQLDTTTPPAPVASTGTTAPNMTQPPAKLTPPAKKKPTASKKPTAKKRPSKKPAATRTPKPAAKPARVKTKAKKTPKPAHGKPPANKHGLIRRKHPRSTP